MLDQIQNFLLRDEKVEDAVGLVEAKTTGIDCQLFIAKVV